MVMAARFSPRHGCRPAAAMESDVLPSGPDVRTSSRDVESRAVGGLASAAMDSTVIFVDGVGPGLAVFRTPPLLVVVGLAWRFLCDT